LTVDHQKHGGFMGISWKHHGKFQENCGLIWKSWGYYRESG
jgi:hypothetical protein